MNMGDVLKLRVPEIPRLEKATYKTKSGPHDGSKTQRERNVSWNPVSATMGSGWIYNPAAVKSRGHFPQTASEEGRLWTVGAKEELRERAEAEIFVGFCLVCLFFIFLTRLQMRWSMGTARF